jgi:hypothetical protein
VVKWLAAVALLAGLLAAGQACTLLDEDPPDDSCSTDDDCFRAQGEQCVNKRCTVIMMIDAGVDAP